MIRFLALMLLPVGACAEVPQGAPNADFSPAFAEQTRAPALPASNVQVDVLTDKLDRPWGIAPISARQFIVTERGGTMRIINGDGSVSAPIRGLPEIESRQQGGLLDVAVSPDFANDRVVFWTYSKPVNGGTVTAAARGVLSGGEMTEVRDIFVQNPPSRAPFHYGSRIIPMPDGTVWITTGERNEERHLAQDNTTTYGKVIRINADGSIPADNPFVGGGGDDAIWSYGHRNPQGAAIGPDGALWTIEHGPAGGDELNRPEAGRNYGWPIISYGVNYNGSDVGSGVAVQEGMEQPVYYWDPVIAPSGMAFYDGPYGPWQGDLLIGSLNPGELVRLKLENGRVVGEERLLQDMGRMRDVEVLPDGTVLVLMDNSYGVVLRVRPR